MTTKRTTRELALSLCRIQFVNMRRSPDGNQTSSLHDIVSYRTVFARKAAIKKLLPFYTQTPSDTRQQKDNTRRRPILSSPSDEGANIMKTSSIAHIDRIYEKHSLQNEDHPCYMGWCWQNDFRKRKSFSSSVPSPTWE